ncbi:MAG: hypothetical protein HFJ86_06925 [Oscillospiraceae bacterium]|jgi:hypothetical protein|nr:hypothetical protein [Oscillospiraceae bacterium]
MTRVFALFEGFSEIDEEVLDRCERGRVLSWRKWGALAACCCVVLAAVMGLPRLFGPEYPAPREGDGGEKPYHYLLLPDREQGAEEVPDEDEARKKGSPAAEERVLTLEIARGLEPFGQYLPQTGPEGFREESVRRYRDENSDFLSVLWTKEWSPEELSWRVERYDEAMAGRVTAVEDRENYDMGVYFLPLTDSVPEELWEIVDHPIFRAEELTLEAVQSRVIPGTEGDDGARMSFGVKYGDMVVEVNAKGISAEWVYERLVEVGKNN